MIAGRLDSSFVLFWISLGVSAAIVGLFLWLMREEPPGEVDPDLAAAEKKERVDERPS